MKRLGFTFALLILVSFLTRSEASADTIVCDQQGCISEEKLLNNIVSMLDNNVTGYVVIVGGLQPAVGGPARTPSDPPATAMSPDLPMNIASVSKTLTAVAVLQLLAKNGKQGTPIDASIGRYIYKDWNPDPSVQKITFRQLLTHTSGLAQADSNCGNDVTYVALKTLVTSSVTPGTAQYGNCNFALLRELFPSLLGQSVSNLPDDAQRAQASSNIYITYMNQNVFAPLGIPTSACKPAGTSEILSYPFPPGSTNGDSWDDWSLKCGSGGWVLKASDVFKVINDLATGNVLLTNKEKSQMISDWLGWDNSVRGDCPTPYVCKNGNLYDGNGISVWTYAGIFKSVVPVVVYVNSFLPWPYQPYDASGKSIPTSSGDIIGLVATAYNCAEAPQAPSACPCLLNTSNAQFHLNDNNSPLQVWQGGASAANLIMDGSWVAADHGVNAYGQVVPPTILPKGTTISLSLGFEDWYGGDPHTGGLMNIYVSVPLLASTGLYCAEVKATDLVSGSKHSVSATVPIQIIACMPIAVCPPNSGYCGSISNGCGGTIECGTCGAQLICSNSHCCAHGYFYNTGLNTCEPSSCPPGTSYCYYLGACTTPAKCKDHPICQKVNERVECQ